MQSLILSFKSIMPIFMMMFLGYWLKKLKLADKSNFDVINSLVFKVFLPVLLFYNIYKTDSSNVFDTKLIAFTIVCVLAVFALGYFAVISVNKDNAKKGVMLQAFFRSNYAILGVPLVGYVCGDGAGALASMMVAVVIPVFNVLAVISLEIFRHKESKINILPILKGIVTNPLIIGCAFGLVFLLLNIKFPDFIEKPVKDISALATPLALIVLGANFEFSSIRGYVKELVFIVLSRLIIVPLTAIPLGILSGFRGEALACIMIVFASPVAVSSYAMAKQMDGDETLAGQAVVLTSAFCLITLFLWIWIIGSLGYF